MTNHLKKVFIIKPSHELPEIGYFAVKFGRGALDQPVSVKFANDLWIVFVDGIHVATSPSWRLAFGPYANFNCFMGRPIDEREYYELVALRRRDVERGIDVNAPDLNIIPPPEFKNA